MPTQSTDPLITEPSGCGSIYLVEPGDSLTAIVNRNAQMTLLDPQKAIQIVMNDNPHIRDPNLIFPGQAVFLRSASCGVQALPPVVMSDVQQSVSTLTANRGPEMSAIAQNAELVQFLMGTTKSFGDEFNNIVRSNKKGLTDLISKHGAYRSAGVSRSGYKAFDKSRTNVLQKIQRDFGSATKPLLGDTAKKATTLKPGLSKNPTVNMAKAADRLSKVSTGMKYGGRVLLVADLAVTAHVTHKNVCAADSRLEKNQHLADGVGSIGGGMAGGSVGAAIGGAIVAVALGSNPAGWAVLLIVGGAAAAGGYFGGKGGGAAAKKVYTEYGTGYDLVEASGMDSLCP